MQRVRSVFGMCVLGMVCAVSAATYPVSVPNVADVKLLGYAGVKADRLFAARVTGAEARGRIYDEAVNAFRTHYDDCHPKAGSPVKKWGLWQGEYWGKTMLSAAGVAEYLGDAALKRDLREKARTFTATYQRTDGYLGSYSDADFLGGPRPDFATVQGWKKEYFCWNVWGRKYTLWALIELARVTDSPEALAAARRLADHLIEQLASRNIPIAQTGFFAGIPSSSILKPMLLLHRATGEAKYRAFAEKIVRDFDRADGRMPNFVANAFSGKVLCDWYPEPIWWAKAYETLSCLEGLVDWAVHENDARVLEAVKRILAGLERDELNVFASVGFFDHFSRSATYANAGTEPCDVTHWIRANREMFLATDDPHYLDVLERAYLNAFLAGVYRDGVWGAHMVRSQGSRHRAAPHQVNMRYHQCCIDNMPRTFTDIAGTVITRTAAGVLSVNLYSDAVARLGDACVTLSGNYPYGDEVTVRVETEKGGRVRFRVPAAFDALRIDGVRAPGAWYETTVPPGGKTFTLVFTRTPRCVPHPGNGTTPTDALAWEKAAFVQAEENPEMVDFLRTRSGTAIWYGPVLLAKGLRAGTDTAEIFRDRLASGETCPLALAPAPRRDTDGAWLLTLEKAGEKVTIPVGDFASIADTDDARNRFSVWF